MIPNINVKADWKLLGVAGLILGGYFYMMNKAAGVAGDAAAVVGGALDPTSPDNLAAAGVAAVGEAVTGEEGWTPGGALYDIGHSVEVDPDTGQTVIVANPLGKVLDWVAGV